MEKAGNNSGMTSGTQEDLKCLSILLRYPDPQWLEMLSQIADGHGEMKAFGHWKAVQPFFHWARQQSLLALQEKYTASFDVSPATSLDLTYHRFGDGEQRDKALSRLRDIYSRAGYEQTSTELPDHLPVLLEFLSLAPDGCREASSICAGPARKLAENLVKNDNPYAVLVQAASRLLDRLANEAMAQKEAK